jgi:hypothetical protein
MCNNIDLLHPAAVVDHLNYRWIGPVGLVVDNNILGPVPVVVVGRRIAEHIGLERIRLM